MRTSHSDHDPDDQTNLPERMLQELRTLRARLAKLTTSEEHLLIRDQAVAAASCGVIIADATKPDFPVIDINPAFERITGYTAAKVLGRNCRMLQSSPTDPEAVKRSRRDNADALREIRSALRSGRESTVILQNYRKDGRLIWVELFISPVRNPQGQVTHFVGIQTDITERKRAEEERQRLLEHVSAARAEAEEAVRVRQEFVSIASHELKTPLTTVKGYVQLLDHEIQRPDPNHERLQRMSSEVTRQVRRLEELVADLLDVSRLQHGRLELRPERIDLTQLAQRIMKQFERAPERRLEHRLVVDAPEPVIGYWDDERLDQMVSNLVSNALKYSPEGGEVRLSVRQSDHHAVVEVRDQGIGISPDEQARLFQPFVRAAPHDHNISGTGLGLYITKHIAERHGGSICVESEPEKGSTFTVRLPLKALERDNKGPD